MLDLIERKEEDMDRLTVATAQGYAISMSSEYAAKWTRDHRRSEVPSAAAAQRQDGTIGRLAAMFPGAVKAKAN